MDFWTFVLLVTFVGCSIPLSKLWLDHRERTLSAGDPDEALVEVLDGLKARVAVLEEIVTDSGYQLKRELDSLDDSSRDSGRDSGREERAG